MPGSWGEVAASPPTSEADESAVAKRVHEVLGDAPVRPMAPVRTTDQRLDEIEARVAELEKGR
jgi:hypothetical protein